MLRKRGPRKYLEKRTFERVSLSKWFSKCILRARPARYILGSILITTHAQMSFFLNIFAALASLTRFCLAELAFLTRSRDRSRSRTNYLLLLLFRLEINLTYFTNFSKCHRTTHLVKLVKSQIKVFTYSKNSSKFHRTSYVFNEFG